MLKISTKYKPGQRVWFVVDGKIKYNFVYKVKIEVTESTEDYDEEYYRDVVSVKAVYEFKNGRQMPENKLYESKEDAIKYGL